MSEPGVSVVAPRDRLVLDAVELAYNLAALEWGSDHPAAKGLGIILTRASDRLARAAHAERTEAAP